MDDVTHNRARRVTVKDVARHAGVSIGTVSNVLNGRHDLMGAQTRARVEAAIQKLNYRPHLPARGLRQTRHYAVGLLVVDPSPYFLANPYVTQIVAGLGNYLSDQGYRLVVQRLRPEEYQQAPVLRYAGTDGMCAILSGPAPERREFLDVLVRLEQPIVLFEESLRPEVAHACIIREDDRGGARAVVELLLRKGARRFAVVVPSREWPGMMERRHGFESAVAMQQDASCDVVFAATADYDGAIEALQDYLDRHDPPDAIVAGNDHMGIAALKAVQARGYSVPEDICVTGFNGLDVCRYAIPTLTSVAVPCYEIGVTAGQELLYWLEHGAFSAPERVLPVRLQAGGSA